MYADPCNPPTANSPVNRFNSLYFILPKVIFKSSTVEEGDETTDVVVVVVPLLGVAETGGGKCDKLSHCGGASGSGADGGCW